MRKAAGFAAPFLVAIAVSAAADTAPKGGHYRNVDYQFSVAIPNGLLGCVPQDTNNGVSIFLDHRHGCDGNLDRRPHVAVYANYNAAGESDTPEGLARRYCPDETARRIVWLKGWSLGGRNAAGCRKYLHGGEIVVDIMALRKTDPRNPEIWIEVGAELVTTASRYNDDMGEFREIVKGIHIAPDGPLG